MRYVHALGNVAAAVLLAGISLALLQPVIAQATWQDDAQAITGLNVEFNEAVAQFNAAGETADRILRADMLHNVQVITDDTIELLLDMEPEPCAVRWWRMQVSAWTLQEESARLLTAGSPAGAVLSAIAAGMYQESTKELERSCGLPPTLS